MYYRCLARTLVPGAAALEEHPKTVNLREDVIAEALNGWTGRLFSRENRDATVRALAAAQGMNRGSSARRETLEQTVADARERLRRNQAAIEAAIDPAAVAEAMNEAYAAKQVAETELGALPNNENVTEAEISAMINSFGDVDDILANAKQRSSALRKNYTNHAVRTARKHREGYAEPLLALT